MVKLNKKTIGKEKEIIKIDDDGCACDDPSCPYGNQTCACEIDNCDREEET